MSEITPKMVKRPPGNNLPKGDVEQIQRDLSTLGYDIGAVDGEFGPRTQGGITAFQSASGIAADGVVGGIR